MTLKGIRCVRLDNRKDFQVPGFRTKYFERFYLSFNKQQSKSGVLAKLNYLDQESAAFCYSLASFQKKIARGPHYLEKKSFRATFIKKKIKKP